MKNNSSSSSSSSSSQIGGTTTGGNSRSGYSWDVLDLESNKENGTEVDWVDVTRSGFESK